MSLGAYVKVPTSVVEHLWLLTPAETALTLMVLRRGSRAGSFVPVSISDENWQKWTGLSPRQREYAIAGLRQKGLSMEGRGDRAKFTFDVSAFQAFAKSAAPAEVEVRTKGRAKGVTVPAGTIVHEDCKRNGCQMLCGTPEQSCTPSAVVSLPVIVPASPKSPERGETVAGGNGYYVDLKPRHDLVSQPRRKNGKSREAETDLALMDRFSATVQTFHRLGFVGVGGSFVRALLDRCGNVDDAILASAVERAYELKRGRQQGEGLFLLTVPPLVKAVPAKQAAAQDGGGDLLGAMRDGMKRLSSEIPGCERLALQVNQAIDDCNPESILDALDALTDYLKPVAMKSSAWASIQQKWQGSNTGGVHRRMVLEALGLPSV